MNYTKSGIIAVGAPHSVIRLKNELENALEKDLCLLLLTEEGEEVVRRFSRVEGCDWESMTTESKAEILNRPNAWKYFSGVLFGLMKN